MVPDDYLEQLLSDLGPATVRRAAGALTAGTPAGDWDRNFLALIYGNAGELKQTVLAHEDYFDDMGLPLWDSEFLDIVGLVTGLGPDAMNLQFLHMQEPERLLAFCEASLAHE